MVTVHCSKICSFYFDHIEYGNIDVDGALAGNYTSLKILYRTMQDN